MQVIILAGGEGTRLRPLTEDMPKPLVRVLGVSAIERLTARLYNSGFREAWVADFYLADKLENALGDYSNGVKLTYVREDIPLGTAGCVKKAWNGDDVMVLSGDSVCDFDFKGIADFHIRSEADITIVSHEVADPREYGLVTADESGRVTGFCEKPSYDSCLTDVANTGTYVISKSVMERIPDCEDVDFARDVFPTVLNEGGKIYTAVEKGYWFDIGDVRSLLECQSYLLDMSGNGDENMISGGAKLGEGSSVRLGSVIESGVTAGRNCEITGSLVMRGASLGDGCRLDRCVICDDVTAGRGVSFGEYCAVGEGVVIGSSVTIGAGVRIARNSNIPSGVRVRRNLSGGGYKTLEIGERGSVEGISLSTENLLNLGKAISAAFSQDVVTVGYEKGCEPLFEALSLGLRAMGTSVYILPDAAFGETVFTARRLKSVYAVYISETGVRVFRSGTCDLTRTDERKLAEKYNRAELKDKTMARLISADAEREVYISELRNALPKRFAGAVKFLSDSERENELFCEASKDLLRERGDTLAFWAGDDVFGTSCRFRGGEMCYEELLLLGCRSLIANGGEVVLAQRAPLVCDEYAKAAGSEVKRLFSSDEGEISQFSFDPLFLAAYAVRYLYERQLSASAAKAELPTVCYYRKTAAVGNENGSGLPKLLSREFSRERKGADIIVENGAARAFVRPLRNGKELSMYVESVSQEAAESICGDILARLRQASCQCGLDKRSDL